MKIVTPNRKHSETSSRDKQFLRSQEKTQRNPQDGGLNSSEDRIDSFEKSRFRRTRNTINTDVADPVLTIRQARKKFKRITNEIITR